MPADRIINLDLQKLISEYAVRKGERKDPNKPIQCYCPLCQEYGEPNSKPTLYVYLKDMTYYCYRCHTFGRDIHVVPGSKEYNNQRLEEKLKEEQNPIIKNLKLKDINISHLPLIHSEEFINYFINKRSIEYLPHLDKWNLRETIREGRKGFLIPFIYDNHIYNYQIRFIDVQQTEGSKIKYYTHSGVKLPYFVDQYDSKKEYDKITLVEGVMDAMAAKLFDLPNPIAVLGSAIPSQIYQFLTESVHPKEIIYAFDDMKINNKIRQIFNDYIHVAYYINTHGSDLDEFLRQGKVPYINSYETLQSKKNLSQNRLKFEQFKRDNHGAKRRASDLEVS